MAVIQDAWISGVSTRRVDDWVPVLVILAVFPDDFTISVDANTVDDGSAGRAFFFLRFRGLVLGPDACRPGSFSGSALSRIAAPMK